MNRTTEARKIASRENGKKGGVKTIEGKMVSRRNAIKHGILANAIRFNHDKMNVQAIHAQLSEEFEVKTLKQEIVLEQLVVCYIRLARCAKFEAEIIDEAINTEKCGWKELEEMAESGRYVKEGHKLLVNETVFNRMEVIITRYEPMLQKKMFDLIEKLQSFQTNTKI